MEDSTLRLWQSVLETTLRDYLTKKYPGEMATYDRFRKKVGLHCNFTKAAARLMFKSEAVSKSDFLSRFKSNNWDGYTK